MPANYAEINNDERGHGSIFEALLIIYCMYIMHWE